MVLVDMFQRALGDETEAATPSGESDLQSQTLPGVETVPAFTHCDSASVHLPITTTVQSGSVEPILALQSGSLETNLSAADAKDREIVRLQHTLTEAKTASSVREIQLRVIKDELNSAREALNQTFAEYTSLRNELKTVKQALGRDHQAIIYRKDIELFASRKINEQKQKGIEERDVKLAEMHCQHRTAIEVKDEQLKILKDHLSLMDRQSSPKFGYEKDEGDHALEVRLLKVRKGRNSLDVEDEKDALIHKLQGDLATATRAADAVVNQQAELQRAWDTTKKIQNALKEERDQHTETREQLQEATGKLSGTDGPTKSSTDSAGRLPTIEEDEHDRSELKAMFDAAQQDNLRLYAEVQALEKRLHEGNAKMFASIQDAEVLRKNLSLEKAINSDMETARPSVVHRVHFQRMEGQLKEIRSALKAKDGEIRLLQDAIAEKDIYARDLKGEVDAAVSFHTLDQDEIQRLKQSVSELQATKEQLMLNHEHFVSRRTRERVQSAERPSARSSGATLIHETSPRLTRLSDEPACVEALPRMPQATEYTAKISDTRKHHTCDADIPKSNPNRWTLRSNDVLPSETQEVKAARRKSLGLRDMMRKMVRKDEEHYPTTGTTAATEVKVKELDRSKMRNALARMDTNSVSRPQTATSMVAAKSITRKPVQGPSAIALDESVRPLESIGSTTRYYAAQPSKETERPGTATGGEETRSSNRRSWGAT